jgi:hypothetical protein
MLKVSLPLERMEEIMRRTALYIGFVLTCTVPWAMPGATRASEAYTPHVAHVQRVVHRLATATDAIPAETEALSRVAPTLRAFDDSDGLSRDRGECNRGCVDN